MRSKVDIESVAEDFSCWQRFGWNLGEKSSSAKEPEAASVGWGGSVDHSGVASSCGNKHGWQWHKDPRLDCLGFRGIFPSDATRKFCYLFLTTFFFHVFISDQEVFCLTYSLIRQEIHFDLGIYLIAGSCY